MTPQEFYQTTLEKHSTQLRRVSRTRNYITTLKLLCFAAIVLCIYRLIASESTDWIWIGIGLIAGFIVLTIWDSRVATRITELKTLIRCCRTETDYLEGNLSALPAGDEYLDPAHPYALDLDLFGEESLFQSLNRTVTPNGTQRLVDWLLHPCRQADRIVRRQQAAEELAGLPEWMLGFRATGMIHTIKKNDRSIITRWLEAPRFFRNRSAKQILYMANGISILLWIAMFCGWVPLVIAWAGFALQLGILCRYIKRINKLSQQLDHFAKAIETYNHLVERITAQPFTSAKLQELQQTFTGEPSAAKALGVLSRILNGFDQRNNVLVEIALNGFYLKDLHHVLQLDAWRETYKDQVLEWIEAISRVDALVSMGTYHFNHPEYCTPGINDEVFVQAREMGHPLLENKNKVCNDFTVRALHDLYIVTGANMAGKSTFLRTVGVNLVLALSGNVVCSDEFTFRPMALFTSMRTTDNLAKGTSYFHAELLRLQQLVAAAEQEERMFIILDEMLKGTNSQDKLNGSLKFLTRLQKLPVAGLIATHDLALGELAVQDPQHFHNVCFEIEHTGDRIHYDYKLREGVSRNMNASILLQQMGLI